MKNKKMAARMMAAAMTAMVISPMALGTAPVMQAAVTAYADETSTFNLSDWTYKQSSGKIILTAYNGRDTNIKIPARINGCSVQYGLGESDAYTENTVKFTHVSLSSLSFEPGVKFPANSNHLFYDLECDTLDLTGVLAYNVVNARGMFQGCHIRNFTFGGSVMPQVTNMSYMFADSDIRTFKKGADEFNLLATQVKDMSGMFSGCTMTSLDLSELNTAKVQDMSYMFSSGFNGSNLTSLDLSNFNTSNVTNTSNMFAGCAKLSTLDLSMCDFSNAHSANGMFNMDYGNTKSALTRIKAPKAMSSDVTADLPATFVQELSDGSYDTSLKFAAISVDTNGMNLVKYAGTIVLDDWDWTYNAGEKETTIFLKKYNGTDTDIYVPATRYVSTITDSAVLQIGTGDGTAVDTGSIQNLHVNGGVLPKNSSNLLSSNTNLKSVDLSSADSSSVEDMSGIFDGDTSLSTITMPAKLASSVSISLPATYKESGTDTIYKTLNSTAAGKTFVLTATSTDDDKPDTPTPDKPTSKTSTDVAKYFVVKSDTAVPTENFQYTIENGTAKQASDGKLAIYIGTSDYGVTGSPSISAGGISFNDSDTASSTVADGDSVTIKDGQAYVKKTIAVDFSGVTFTEPGVYRYVIKETDGSARGISYDTEKPASATALTRYLDVYVMANDDESVYISDYVLHSTDCDITVDATTLGSSAYASTEKSDGYVNDYTAYDLKISDAVTGNQSSRDKYFQITVNIANAAPNSELTIDLSGADETVGSNFATLDTYENQTNPGSKTTDDSGNATITLYLHHGQDVTIHGLTAGTQYTVTETEEDYKPSMALTGDTKNTADGDIASVSADTVTDSSIEADTTVAITNTRNGVIPTGVMLSMVPYVLAAGVAGIGIAAAASRKKKKEEDQ